MAELMQASRQWASRPADERFTSLLDMSDHFHNVRNNSRAVVVSSRKLEIRPAEGDELKGLQVFGPNGIGYSPTNWSYGQIAQLAEAPAGYTRTLPAPLAADCLNYGLKVKRDIEDVGILLCKDGTPQLTAATGPRYGRIWNSDIVDALVKRFGDGTSGDFRVPGEFGKAVEVTKRNTTLFAGDRDMFVFLADESNRIENPNRRNGQSGSLARGFFVWNSEVGSSTFGIGTFLFDYACSNRIVWGAEGYREIKIRHTASAPDRFIEEVGPALISYANSSTESIDKALAEAKAKRIGDDSDEVNTFLANRFGKGLVSRLQAVHELEEGRPIETLWDATTAVTAYARGIEYQDQRVELERKGGALLDLVAN